MPHEATSFSTLLDLYNYFFENDLIVSLRPVSLLFVNICFPFIGFFLFVSIFVLFFSPLFYICSFNKFILLNNLTIIFLLVDTPKLSSFGTPADL